MCSFHSGKNNRLHRKPINRRRHLGFRYRENKTGYTWNKTRSDVGIAKCWHRAFSTSALGQAEQLKRRTIRVGIKQRTSCLQEQPSPTVEYAILQSKAKNATCSRAYLIYLGSQHESDNLCPLSGRKIKLRVTKKTCREMLRNELSKKPRKRLIPSDPVPACLVKI